MHSKLTKYISLILAIVMIAALMPGYQPAAKADAEGFAGKTVSILSHSASTYAGVSNNTAYNSTIGNNDVYYTAGRHGVYLKDTWWQQAIDALGMRLLVNNSWSGSCVFQPRKGAASVTYKDRAVNLHNDHTGEEPDIIWVYIGGNDFAYYKDTFGKAADVDYSALIKDNGDGTFTYAAPANTCEAYAITLHKAQSRYPDAQIYCMTSTARRETDYTGDSYPDAGQPTEYSAQLQAIAEHFGYPVIDLEKAIPKDTEIFDKYMGDKRAHPNALGMDQITNELLSVMLGRDAEICHVTSEQGVVAEQAVLKGGSYSVEVELPDGYSVTVAMAGKDITAEAWQNGCITIEEVTGDITVTSHRPPMQFAWEVSGSELISAGENENLPKKLEGTITDGVFNNGRYELTTPVILRNDLPWVVEWKCAGDWRAAMLSSDSGTTKEGTVYLTRTKGGQLCFGTRAGSQYDNYGVDLSELDAQSHTYRLENRIAADGGNMVWLYLDGAELGPMNNYFIGSNGQNKTSDWVSGKEFVFSYIGTDSNKLSNCELEYLQVKECDHTYENGICIACGAVHPNMVNFEGKVISVLSASTSTFAGYIPVADGFNLTHRARYPQDNLLTDVDETWWMQLVNALDAKLGINDSWAGSQVLNTQDTNSGDLGPDAAMASLTRIKNLGANGTPDVILFFGAGNDIGRGVALSSFDPASAPTTVDLTSTKWDSLADAYVAAIMRLQHFYPDSEIVAMTTYAMPGYATEAKLNRYGAVIEAICEHYGVPYLNLRDSGVTFDMLPDNIHPNAEGMDHITEAVLNKLLNDVELGSGENTVYSVTHELSSVKASLGYYKGISAGKPFAETLSGDDLTVTVTMGGKDITASCYADGKVNIPAVTGDVKITAKARFNADGHLQQLPEKVCAGTNLWTALEPENIYYTVNGWGNTTAGTSWSITFPVTAGDRIWATSLGAYPGNGSTANGVRITWFDENGVLKTVAREQVYAEFARDGYVTAPEGATALNVPMTGNEPNYAIYLLDRDHDYETVITQPTCTEQGYTTYTCACGDSYVADYTDELGHTPGEAVKENEAADGAYDSVVYCTACGAELSREHVEGKTHTPGDINGDGSVNNKDFTRLFQCLADWDVEVVEAALDVNGDGTVNNKDLTRLFQYLSDWDVVIH